jgi:hypothetical protein
MAMITNVIQTEPAISPIVNSCNGFLHGLTTFIADRSIPALTHCEEVSDV